MINPTNLSEIIARGQTMLFTKMRPKKRIELCKTMTWDDDELGTLIVFYRVIDAPLSNQSDDSSDAYTIECVTLEGAPVNISGRMEQEMLEHLNLVNPMGLKWPVRGGW